MPKIIDLPPAQIGTDADLYIVDQAVNTRKQTRTQLRTAISPTLPPVATLSPLANSFIVYTAPGTAIMATVSPAARELLNDADYAAMLVTLGAASAASPTFTGTVTVPTPGAGDSTTKAASTAFLKAPGPIGSVTPNTGGFTTLSASGAFTPSQTAGIVGTTTVNNANAGSIGEHITASVASTAITTGVAANTASIVLTPGDWEVSGSIQFVPTGVPTSFAGGISTTSAALPAGGQLSTNFYGMTLASGTAWSFPVPTQRINVASNTTVYLVGQSGFGGTAVTNATIRARRVR